MPGFQAILKAAEGAVRDLARRSWGDYRSAAVKDGAAFLDKTREDLKRWSALLATGELKPDEFEFLLQAKQDLAELQALKQKGLAAARLAEFRGALIKTIVGAVVGAVV